MIPSIFLYLDLQIIISTYASNRFANFDIEISKDYPLSVKNSHLKERKKENEISEISFPSRRYRVSQRKYRFFAFASSLRNVAIRRSQRQHGTETRSHSRSHRNHVKPMVMRSEIQVYKAAVWPRSAAYVHAWPGEKRMEDPVVAQASSFKRFVVPREGVNRIHDSPRVSLDSPNCLPPSLSLSRQP